MALFSLFQNLSLCLKHVKAQCSLLALTVRLPLNTATLPSDWSTVAIPTWSSRLSSLSRLTTWHKEASFATHSVSLKHAASHDYFSKRNLWSSSHNSKALASNLLLESHLTSMYKRRHVCFVSISSQSCMNRRELRACTLMWLIILITSWKMLLGSGDIFWVVIISLWMKQCIDSHSEATSLTWLVKPEGCQVLAATPSVHIPVQNDQFHFPDVIIQRLE